MKKINYLLFSIISVLLSCESDQQKNSKNSLAEKNENFTFCTFDLLQKSNNIISKPSAAIISWKWNTGQTIRIKFLDGNTVQQEKVKAFAEEWTNYANLKFEYVNSSDYADIRIGFNLTGSDNRFGAWSELGAKTAYMPQNTQTMRLGPLTATDENTNRRTVLHEFGHALGLFHETTNPAANIQWDFPKTYQYYSTQFTKDEVDLFIINKENTTDFSEYDPLSIMHYYIPASITTDGKAVYEQSNLSDIDKKSINTWYPFPIVSTLESGQSINGRPWKDHIKSPNGRYYLEFIPGVLRIVDLNDNSIIWTVGNKNYVFSSSCYFDSNGNITLRGGSTPITSSKILWNSNTYDYPGAKLQLQDDGDLQLIYNGAVKWSSKSGKI